MMMRAGMSKTSRRKSARKTAGLEAGQAPRVGKTLKLALCVALPFAVAAAVILHWERMFPVPADKLVEVVWKHECTCAHGWMQSLRAAGFVVRDFEMDDLSAQRKRWRVPDSVRGCHPASFMGYFLDGHISGETLLRLSRERPVAIGVQKRDTVQPDRQGASAIVSSQLLLFDRDGKATVWK